MKIIVCIGSSCHLKGSRQVVDKLRTLIAEQKLESKIELGGTFCLGQCQKGVCVKIDDGEDVFSVTPDTVGEFFAKDVLPRL